MGLVRNWGDDSLSQPAADSSLREGALRSSLSQRFPKASLSEGGGPVGAGRSPSPHILTNTICLCIFWFRASALWHRRHSVPHRFWFRSSAFFRSDHVMAAFQAVPPEHDWLSGFCVCLWFMIWVSKTFLSLFGIRSLLCIVTVAIKHPCNSATL